MAPKWRRMTPKEGGQHPPIPPINTPLYIPMLARERRRVSPLSERRRPDAISMGRDPMRSQTARAIRQRRCPSRSPAPSVRSARRSRPGCSLWSRSARPRSSLSPPHVRLRRNRRAPAIAAAPRTLRDPARCRRPDEWPLTE